MRIEDKIKYHLKCDKDAFGREISEEDIKIGQRISQIMAEEAERLSLERDKRFVLMAIKKQTPKKPNKLKTLSGLLDEYSVGYCPSCGKGVNDIYDYCPKCGQRLDFGVTSNGM